MQELYSHFLKHPEICTDTRDIKKGALFFALKGDNFNGNQFAEKALNDGCSLAVIDEPAYKKDERYFLVQDVLGALQQLANHHRKQLSIPVLAITGSNGKTTSKELVNAVLTEKYKVLATKGNLNNHIGVPLTLLQLRKEHEIAIIEMGANHAGEIAAYCQWAMPSHALITNCGKAHLEGFGSVEGVRKAKGELYDWIRETQGILFRNADLDYLFTMSQGITKQVTYGSGAADIRGVVSDPESETLSVAILTPHHECSIQTQLAGVYNLSNVLAAFAIGVHFGIPASTTKNALEAYSPDNSRSQWIQKGTNTILLDAYNANPSSMQAAIMNFRQRDAANKVLLLGAMMELGNESIAEHQMVTDLIAQSNWKAVVLVGGDFKHIQHPYQYFDSVAEAAAWYKEQKFSHTHILIKGSRAMTMEKILED